MVDVDVCVGIVIKCCMRRVDEGETESKGSRKIGVEKGDGEDDIIQNLGKWATKVWGKGIGKGKGNGSPTSLLVRMQEVRRERSDYAYAMQR